MDDILANVSKTNKPKSTIVSLKEPPMTTTKDRTSLIDSLFSAQPSTSNQLDDDTTTLKRQIRPVSANNFNFEYKI